MSKRWNRPALPGGNIGLEFGVIVILAGLVALAVGGFVASGFPMDVNPVLTMALGGFLVAAGAWFLTVRAIVREIQQAAYEAAIRAGEVETKKPGAA